MDDERKLKLNVELDKYKGTLTINLYDFFRQLGPDACEDLRDVWGGIAYEEIADKFRTGYSTDSFNSAIQKLRIAILTDDNANLMFRACLKGLLHEWIHERLNRERYERAYYVVRQKLSELGINEDALGEYRFPPRVTEADVDAAIERYTKNFPREPK